MEVALAPDLSDNSSGKDDQSNHGCYIRWAGTIAHVWKPPLKKVKFTPNLDF